MGKSIDEIIDCFMRLKYVIDEGENVDSTKYDVYPVTISFEKEHCMEIKEVVYSAIDIMRKYQKIQEIYLKWNRNGDISTSDAWSDVIGVLEDGKID